MALCTVVDPEAVQQAIKAGVGATLRITVGGKRAPEYFEPVTLDAYVKSISDGVFTFKGPGMRGVPHQMGRTVVLYAGNIHLVVMEHAVSQWDPQLYRSVGEEPSDARMVQVKSPMAFRAGYEGIFDEVVIVAAPGAANPDIAGPAVAAPAAPHLPAGPRSRLAMRIAGMPLHLQEIVRSTIICAAPAPLPSTSHSMMPIAPTQLEIICPQLTSISHTRTLALWERARAVMPGGVNASARMNPALGHPLFFERGQGAYLFDVGRQSLHRLLHLARSQPTRPRAPRHRRRRT